MGWQLIVLGFVRCPLLLRQLDLGAIEIQRRIGQGLRGLHAMLVQSLALSPRERFPARGERLVALWVAELKKSDADPDLASLSGPERTQRAQVNASVEDRGSCLATAA